MKLKTLSAKRELVERRNDVGQTEMFLKRDVKEFIKEETKLIQLWMSSQITAKMFWERRRNLAGGDLIE